jgi:hypothetical protein
MPQARRPSRIIPECLQGIAASVQNLVFRNQPGRLMIVCDLARHIVISLNIDP